MRRTRCGAERHLQVSLPVVDNNRKVVGALSVVGEKFSKFWKKLQKLQRFLNKKLSFGNGARSALCRSRRELSNEYLRAKFGFDTAESEP